MIKECNFKKQHIRIKDASYDKEDMPEYEKYLACIIKNSMDDECPGEDKCVLYQIYKQIYGTYDYREHFTKMITDGLIGEHEREEVIPLKEKKPRTYHKHAVTNPNDPGPYTKGLPKELPIKTIDSLLSKKKTTKDGTQTVTWAEVMACAGNEEKLNELFESKRGKKK